MKRMITIMVTIIMMVTMMTTPTMAHNWVEGHDAHIENGDLWVDGKAVGDLIVPYGDVNATPVIVYDPESSISTWLATANSAMELFKAMANDGGYAVLVVPSMQLAFLGQYIPEDKYFGFQVTDTIEF